MNAICRVSKVSGAGSAAGKDAHNKREKQTPNADEARRHLNQEYVNTQDKPLWEVLNGRIEQAGVSRKVRGDAVRGMEFILTASPAFFRRDAQGLAEDVRQSAWVRENLSFMKQRYGSNLVGFMLHQDEKTPHIHAMVVPITKDGRLSAKEMFNPRTLRELQTDYASAMRGFGLERGVVGSRARHQTMKHVYGQVDHLARQVSAPMEKIEPIQLARPGFSDMLNLGEWMTREQERVNKELQEIVKRERTARYKAQKLALSHANAHEQEKILRARLTGSEGLKNKNYQAAVSQSRQLDELSIKITQGQPVTLSRRYEQIRERLLPQITEKISGILSPPVMSYNDARIALGRAFKIHAPDPEGKHGPMIEHRESGLRINVYNDRLFSDRTLDQWIRQAVELTSRQIEQQKQQERQKEADRQEAARQKAEQDRQKEAARQQELAQKRQQFVDGLGGQLVDIVKKGGARTIEQALELVGGPYEIRISPEHGVLLQARTGKGPVINISREGQPRPILEQIRDRVELNIARAQKLAQQQQPKRQVRPRLG